MKNQDELPSKRVNSFKFENFTLYHNKLDLENSITELK